MSGTGLYNRKRIRAVPTDYSISKKSKHNEHGEDSKKRLRARLLKSTREYERHRPEYKALLPDTTRLITLKRPKKHDPGIEIQLRDNVPFTNMGQYDALSYHWGVEQALEPIFILDDDRAGNATPYRDEEMSSNFEDDLAARVLHISHKRLRHRHMYIKQNLYDALMHLLDDEKDVTIWADGICIDQDNKVEKEYQVARMSEIYSNAACVILWLGIGNNQVDKAMDFVEELLSRPERTRELIHADDRRESWEALVELMSASWFSRRWCIQELALAQNPVVLCGNNEVHWYNLRDAISIFADNLEIIRESMRRGISSKDDNLLVIGEIESSHAKRLVDVTASIFRVQHLPGCIRREPLQGLEFLVSTLSNWDASDPRDTINAFRNIAKEHSGGRNDKKTQHSNHEELPKLSYSTTLLEVYVTFFNWTVKKTGSIDLVCRRWALPDSSKSPTALPSWIQIVDDIDRTVTVPRGRRHGDSFVGNPGSLTYNASGRLLAQIELPLLLATRSPLVAPSVTTHSVTTPVADERANAAISGDTDPKLNAHDEQLATSKHRRITSQYDSQDLMRKAINAWQKPGLFRLDASLHVDGMIIGGLEFIFGPTPDGVLHHRVLRELFGEQEVNNKIPPPDRVWRTLVADRGPGGTNPPPLYARACQYALRDLNENGDLNIKALRKQSSVDFMKPFLRRVEGVIWNRCFFKVRSLEGEDVYHGFGPSNITGPGGAHQGDVLCILYGCSVPVVLRPQNVGGTEQTYLLIGEAYVYGIMDGEAVDLAPEQLRAKTVQFKIV